MQITQTRTPIEETSDEQTTTTAIADGGHRSQIERLTDAVEFDYGGDRDGYPFVNLWVTDPVADDRFRMTCVHIDDYYADPEVAAHAFRSAWLESFDELLEPISAEGWLTLREHWERADDDDSAEVEA